MSTSKPLKVNFSKYGLRHDNSSYGNVGINLYDRSKPFEIWDLSDEKEGVNPSQVRASLRRFNNEVARCVKAGYSFHAISRHWHMWVNTGCKQMF